MENLYEIRAVFAGLMRKIGGFTSGMYNSKQGNAVDFELTTAVIPSEARESSEA